MDSATTTTLIAFGAKKFRETFDRYKFGTVSRVSTYTSSTTAQQHNRTFSAPAYPSRPMSRGELSTPQDFENSACESNGTANINSSSPPSATPAPTTTSRPVVEDMFSVWAELLSPPAPRTPAPPTVISTPHGVSTPSISLTNSSLPPQPCAHCTQTLQLLLLLQQQKQQQLQLPPPPPQKPFLHRLTAAIIYTFFLLLATLYPYLQLLRQWEREHRLRERVLAAGFSMVDAGWAVAGKVLIENEVESEREEKGREREREEFRGMIIGAFREISAGALEGMGKGLAIWGGSTDGN